MSEREICQIWIVLNDLYEMLRLIYMKTGKYDGDIDLMFKKIKEEMEPLRKLCMR